MCCIGPTPVKPAIGDGREGRLEVALKVALVAKSPKLRVLPMLAIVAPSPVPRPDLLLVLLLPIPPSMSSVDVARSKPAISLRRLNDMSPKASIMVRRRLDGGALGLVFIVPLEPN